MLLSKVDEWVFSVLASVASNSGVETETFLCGAVLVVRMKFRMVSHQASDTVSDTMVSIESMCRDHESIRVDYQGKDGTVVEAPASALEDLIADVEEERERLWQCMVDADRNSKVDDYEEKRNEWKSVRIQLERLVENDDHKWRVD